MSKEPRGQYKAGGNPNTRLSRALVRVSAAIAHISGVTANLALAVDRGELNLAVGAGGEPVEPAVDPSEVIAVDGGPTQLPSEGVRPADPIDPLVLALNELAQAINDLTEAVDQA